MLASSSKIGIQNAPSPKQPDEKTGHMGAEDAEQIMNLSCSPGIVDRGVRGAVRKQTDQGKYNKEKKNDSIDFFAHNSSSRRQPQEVIGNTSPETKLSILQRDPNFELHFNALSVNDYSVKRNMGISEPKRPHYTSIIKGSITGRRPMVKKKYCRKAV